MEDGHSVTDGPEGWAVRGGFQILDEGLKESPVPKIRDETIAQSAPYPGGRPVPELYLALS